MSQTGKIKRPTALATVIKNSASTQTRSGKIMPLLGYFSGSGKAYQGTPARKVPGNIQPPAHWLTGI